ncbi:substrate-binding and VWA domain-containing protein [Paractinoplanes hotanensis]|uniref:Substrate-binding and VWA domain-containing protein n=1 Tax=Paractinoplanes hotanensis TaxID=2906497 RepID=A0ABT0Y5T1_9ACTN|nr:substrate-binding and VWA domain-containing protein [Actinoplanes hotanensis]MCM4080674.1 substrate-binding and VWA domain-containing protein [Actinoplanes hotanensis]
MAIVVVMGGSYYGYQQLADDGCTGSIRLTLAATSEVAPSIDQVAQRWVQEGANVDGTCVAVTVSDVNSSTMAAAVAGEHKVVLAGVGTAPEAVKVPDIWVPDSSTWLLRLKSEAPGFVPSDSKPIAQSPIVLAMPKPVAEQVGWPNKKMGWAQLLQLMQTSTTLNTGIANPTLDSTGLAGLLAIGQAAGAGEKAQAAKVKAMQALAGSASALRDELIQRFPRSNDPNDIGTSLSAAPVSEENVVSYNAAKPPVPLVALYLDPSPMPLDYPYAIMPEVDLQKQKAAAGLRTQLASATFKNALGAAGLRSPDGSFGAGFARPLGAPDASPPASNTVGGTGDNGGTAAAGFDASALSQVIGSWNAITQPGRVLAVFDVSGSMNTKVPTANNQSRAAVTRRAAAAGLSMFSDKWAVGVWLFSTEMVGKRPWKQIVPISPLASSRTTLQESIGQIVPKEDGNTGLYDTVLDAYKEVKRTWQPGKVNSVILFTDGKNENDDGIKIEKLLSELKRLNDARKPVRLVIIGIGDQVSETELQTIVKATPAGGVFVTKDPAKMSSIFVEAIGRRTGATGG